MATETKKKPQPKPKPKTDNANLESAVTETADELLGATTRVLDQPAGPEIVMTESDPESADESVVVVEQKRIELKSLPDLVTNQSGQVLIYGPFDEYRIVNADFGDYAVTKGLVLGFQIRDFFNKKESRIEKQPFPVYWNAESGERVLGSGIAFKDYKKPGRRA